MLSAIDRRAFLQVSLGGVSTLALMTLLPGCRGPVPEAERFEKLEFFRPSEGAVLEAFAARILPEHPGRPTVAEVELIVRLDREIGWLQANVDPGLGSDLKLLLRLVEYGPLVIGYHWKPFTRLAPEARDDFLRRWELHRIASLRLAFRALRSLVVFFFFADPRSFESIRYAGPWVEGGRERLDAWRRLEG